MSGHIYFTITRDFIEGDQITHADPTDASLYDAYEVIGLSDKLFKYKSVVHEDEFLAKKVADDFTL
ncbi:MAG: hypothetical protein A4S09_09335 [Proteobacteria bacterium SG_bin7]|nr:MAG: hypothetical protein A4S09_09335 [Proteobacteria bacterium SG_bin7]